MQKTGRISQLFSAHEVFYSFRNSPHFIQCKLLITQKFENCTCFTVINDRNLNKIFNVPNYCDFLNLFLYGIFRKQES